MFCLSSLMCGRSTSFFPRYLSTKRPRNDESIQVSLIAKNVLKEGKIDREYVDGQVLKALDNFEIKKSTSNCSGKADLKLDFSPDNLAVWVPGRQSVD